VPLTTYRVVLDTNVLLRGLINSHSASGRILALCEDRKLVPVLSKSVLAEYRYILKDPKIVARCPELEPRKVDVTLARLIFVGDVIRSIKVRFVYPRDPQDAKFIELAIAANATHLVSSDGDILDLPGGHGEASKRFRQRLPTIVVLDPPDFLRRFNDT
jgi:putative PIN family toxin of toxin-antitoxin system